MITHETWCDDLLLVDEHLHANWEAFYDYADKKFKHQELCDCYHRPPTTKGVFDTWLQCENRRFHSEKWNTTVWFFLWYGAKAMPHGYFNISEDIQPLPCMPAMCHENAESSNKWELSPSEFVFEFVKAHNPHLLLINTGLHTAFDGKSDFYIREAQHFKYYSSQLTRMQHKERQHQRESSYDTSHRHQSSSLAHHLRTNALKSQSSVAITKWVFKGVTPRIMEHDIDDMRQGDFGALELAVNNVWEYWDVTALIIELYAVYRKVELPWMYYHVLDQSMTMTTTLQSRGFSWDNLHYTQWVYHELNKGMVDKY